MHASHWGRTGALKRNIFAIFAKNLSSPRSAWKCTLWNVPDSIRPKEVNSFKFRTFFSNFFRLVCDFHESFQYNSIFSQIKISIFLHKDSRLIWLRLDEALIQNSMIILDRIWWTLEGSWWMTARWRRSISLKAIPFLQERARDQRYPRWWWLALMALNSTRVNFLLARSLKKLQIVLS